jgi:uncharacterized membrane protein
VANIWVDKSPSVVLLPFAIQSLLALCLVFSHWIIARLGQPFDYRAPATSALAYGMFAHAHSIYLLAAGLSACIAMMAMPLSFMNVVTLAQSMALFMIVAIVVLCGPIVLGVAYGQDGGRAFAHFNGDDVLLAGEDMYWKCGIFYCNSKDASLLLPERFGIGWTINWARPVVWIVIFACFAVTGGFVAGIAILF